MMLSRNQALPSVTTVTDKVALGYEDEVGAFNEVGGLETTFPVDTGCRAFRVFRPSRKSLGQDEPGSTDASPLVCDLWMAIRMLPKTRVCHLVGDLHRPGECS